MKFHESKLSIRATSIDQTHWPIGKVPVGRAARFGPRLEPLRAVVTGTSCAA